MNTQKISFVSLFMVLVVSLSMIGCSSSASGPGGDDNGNGNGNGGGEPAANEVEMVGQSFTPATIQIEVGATVTWVNVSSLTHTVTSGTDGQHDDKFNSGNIAPGGEFSYQFSEIGEYPYYCIPHVSNGMTGTVNVVDSSSNDY
jgi:plastocyanin